MKKTSENTGTFFNRLRSSKITWVVLLGAFLRLFYIGNIPGNTALYVDEMFSGYGAWSILNYGYEISGYHLPMYLTSWGSGMSALQAYIQIPFIAVFGLTGFALRLPAAILGCITLYAFYYICRSIKNEDFAVFAAFILAVIPWHIIMSRWALDCNYFVGFITITIALMIKASKDNRFLPLAFFFIGISLYAYALTWTVMPLFVLLAVIYLFRTGAIRFDKHFLISVVVLGLTALPALLFMAVNLGMMPEIKTPFFSVPKLMIFRSNELSLSPRAMLSHIYAAFKMFVEQDDGTVTGSTPTFGIYYKISGIFILIGLAECLVSFFGGQKRRGNEVYFLILFFCSLIIAATTDLYFYRINMIQIPMTYFLANGLWFLTDLLQKRSKEIVILAYGILCFFFFTYYITDYDDTIATRFADGSKDALAYVDSLKENGEIPQGSTINVFSGISYVTVLYYEKYPTDAYVSEVVYDPDTFASHRALAQSFGDYYFYYDELPEEAPKSGDVFMCSHDDEPAMGYLEANNMNIRYFSNIAVGVAP